MDEATVIGVDLAKAVFQLHGAAADGTPGNCHVNPAATRGAG